MLITFWQNALSPHQAPLIRQLSAQPGIAVQVVAMAALSPGRSTLKWTVPDYGGAHVTVGSTWAQWKRILRDCPDDSLHVVSGLGGYRRIAQVTRRLALRRSQVFVMTEPWDVRDDKGLRLIIRRARFISTLPWRTRLFFVTGDRAAKQLGRLGIPVRKLRSWGYFPTANYTPHLSRTIDVLFVGSLIERKGLNTLAEALRMMPEVNATIVGDGPLMSSLEEALAGANTTFMGPLESGEVNRLMSSSRVLVLPSLHDGWGAVVNEALLCGCKVALSSNCGSRVLGRSGLPVKEFTAGQSKDLARALREALADTTSPHSVAARSQDIISAHSAAVYLTDALTHPNVTITPPWNQRSGK